MQDPLGSKEPLKMKITPEMMKNFKTLTCDCGGMLFEPGWFFKKLSPLVSPTGKEELYPIEVLICKSCGKVPSELATELLLDEVLAKKPNIIK